MNMPSKLRRAAMFATLLLVMQSVGAAEPLPAARNVPGAVNGAELDAILRAIAPLPSTPNVPKPLPDMKTGAPGVVIVKRGETLDRIITRELGDSPFRRDVLVSVVKQKNPSAFKNPRSRHLAAGTVLLMPGPEDFAHLMPARTTAAPAPRGTGDARPESDPAADVSDPRRNWVRFP